jgi:5-methylcytosine-specific restriction endonuclease McrA
MGNGASAEHSVVNGHGAARQNGHDPSHLNGNGTAPDGEADGEVAVAAIRRLTRGRVLVLNASYEPLNVCTVRRALVLILKEKAEVLEKGDDVLRSETMRIDRPEVIRLISFVRVPRDIHRRRITRKAVLARDGWTCQYCGSDKHGLTVDHVIPRSRGGESVWENIVASCAPCNRRRGTGCLRDPHARSAAPARRDRPSSSGSPRRERRRPGSRTS